MKKAIVVVGAVAALVLTGCGPSRYESNDVVEERYSGTAYVVESKIQSRKSGCKVTLQMPDGDRDTHWVGRRSNCVGWERGRTVMFKDGVKVG
jgi:hypothetical protein